MILANKGVVLAAADIQAGLHPGATLPHDDGSAGHQLSAKSLKAKPLRIRVAPVS